MTKLFINAQLLIAGYNIAGVKNANGKRKVYLVGRILPSGNVVLVIYGYANGKRQRKSTGAILVPEKNANDKTHNMEVLRRQIVKCDELNAQLERSEDGFNPIPKNKINLVDFVVSQSKYALEETGNRNSNCAVFKSLALHLERCFGKNISFKEVSQTFVMHFIEYLKERAINLNYVRTRDEKRRKEVRLSQNSQVRLCRNLNTILTKAVRLGILSSNPFLLIDPKDKPKVKHKTRVFLTSREFICLINTPFPYTRSKADFRNAFIFACFTGLRYSDLKALSAQHLCKNEHGIYIDKVQLKTEGELNVYLDEFVMSFIPKRIRESDEPLFRLPKNGNANSNKAFQQWFVDAGITKHVTWHCARHTTATIMLSLGIPIAIVAKTLGHNKIATTEQYAEITDLSQTNAAREYANFVKGQLKDMTK